MSFIHRFLTWVQTERGASMVEYALLVILIAIVAFLGVQFAGEEISTTFSSVGDAFPN